MLEDDELSILFGYIYSDPAVHALQFLDVINMKDPGQKSQFYRTTLKDILPSIPKVK
jgi:SCY1-like protein 2